MQCGDAPVFIAGDADHNRPVLHEANNEGAIAGSNAASWPKVTRHERSTPLSIVFTDPDLATVGAPLSAIDDAIIGSCDFAAGRALIEGRPGGIVRVYARRDGIIAGAEMAGPAVEYLAHLVAGWVHAGTKVAEALRLPLYHPTYTEDLKDCLRELARCQ
jgi:dihydrolipoamide dehydrogenase